MSPPWATSGRGFSRAWRNKPPGRRRYEMPDDEASFDAKPWLACDGFADRGGESFADIGRALHTPNSRGGHDFVFFLCRTRAAADDGAGVTHTPSGRCGLSR